MMIREIEQLIASGLLDQFDRYFVRALQRLAPGAGTQTLVLAALVRKAVGNGHVCLDLKRLVADDQKERSGAWPLSLSSTELIAELQASPLVSRDDHLAPLVLEGQRLYLQRYWRYEEELAREIRLRAASPVAVREDLLAFCLAQLFSPTGYKSRCLVDSLVGLSCTEQDAQQGKACAGIFREWLGLITGGPGTGKTTLVAKYLALALLYAQESGETPPRILLLAPTGKAAARLSEALQQKKQEPLTQELFAALPDKASTIHRALGYRLATPTTFRYNRDNPLPAEVVVVDEASMIDVALMAKLFAAVPPAARLVLLGDKDQLASVEAGSILGDICAAVMDEERAEESPLARCVIRLTESFRFSPHEGIGALACAIQAGKGNEAVALARQGLAGVSLLPPLARHDPAHPLAEMILAGYRPFLEAADPFTALTLLERFRLLCAHRIGPMGVSALNRYAEKVLAIHGLIEMNGPWYKGRPVLIQANSYPLRLFNGETGILWPSEDGAGLKAFFFSEGRDGVRGYLLRQLPAHETAFAMTIHKSQGSEFDRIVLVLPGEDSTLLSRELLYTGISRARIQVALVGRGQEIEAAVGRRVERASGLQEKLGRTR